MKRNEANLPADAWTAHGRRGKIKKKISFSRALGILSVSALRLLQPKCQFTPTLARIFFWPTLFLRLSYSKKNRSKSRRVEWKLPAAAMCAMMGFWANEVRPKGEAVLLKTKGYSSFRFSCQPKRGPSKAGWFVSFFLKKGKREEELFFLQMNIRSYNLARPNGYANLKLIDYLTHRRKETNHTRLTKKRKPFTNRYSWSNK
jgi:hypothetical protein